MMGAKIEELFRNPAGILSADAPGGDVAISSRIRLARNPEGRPFPRRASDDERRALASEVTAALPELKGLGGTSVLAFEPEQLDAIDREVLLERYLASREFNARPEGTLLAVRPDERVSLMVNEDDALRIQCLRPGLQLDEAWEDASALDDELGNVFKYAFDERLGFLTADPTNVGTGMRASVMLHLPGLVLTGQIASAVAAVNKLNIAVRGLYGEGSENLGNMYQVSNQSTLGESEKQDCEIFNIGTGTPLSVMELVKAFEKVNGVKVNYRIAPRRPGDIIAIWADPTLANEEMGWRATRTIEETLAAAWAWEKHLAGK